MPIDKKSVDVAIIGTGTAGMNAYRAALTKTKSIALIENNHYGTTCARVGCMPSKLLIAAAEAAHHSQHTQAFGVSVGHVEIDGKAVMARVQRERDRFVGFVKEAVEAYNPDHKMFGTAVFKDDHTLLIDDHTEITAKTIVIATGSRPVYPQYFDKVGDRLLTNDDIFELSDLPNSIAVFGTGVIGLELGQALHRLGVKTRVFGRSGSIATLADPEIQTYARHTFAQEFPLIAEATIKAFVPSKEGIDITYIDESGATNKESFEYLLAATGRRPNTDKLGLEQTSIELDDAGVPKFDAYTLQANPGHIFIAGDVNNELALLHEAADEGKIAGANAGSYPDIRAGMRRAPLSVTFTEPQIASVGLNYVQLNQQFPNAYATGQVSFENQGRSRVMLVNKGLLKVYAEHGSGTFLGAEMFGPAAEHIAHLLAWAVQQKMTVNEMLDMPFYHPVIEEGVRTALRDLAAELHKGPQLDQNCLDCAQGA